jgi:hypothetical protein
MSPSTTARLTIAATILCATSGCFLAPSDPAGPSIGIRVDGGVLSAYVPLCPGEKVLDASVSDPNGDGRELWSAKGPPHPTAKLVRLGGSGWREQTGSYEYEGQEILMDVGGTERSYGAGFLGDPLPTDLPPAPTN